MGEGFGSSLAAANFGKSGQADLVVGAATNDFTEDGVPIFSGSGSVNVIHGSARGLTAAGGQYWTQDSAGIFGTVEQGDFFGGAVAAGDFDRDGFSPGITGTAQAGDFFAQALTAGDFDGNGFADLEVGAPGNNRSRGSVNVLYGSTRRLTAAGNEYWTEDNPGIIGVAAPIDQFGWSMVGRR